MGLIDLRAGLCPLTARRAYALYDGHLPIVPATIYLRHLGENVGLEPNSVESYAYALKHLFTLARVRGRCKPEGVGGDPGKGGPRITGPATLPWGRGGYRRSAGTGRRRLGILGIRCRA